MASLKMIDECAADQVNPDRTTGRTRLYPEDCQADLGGFLGVPASTINRRGPNLSADRSVVWNSFGFKVFRFGKSDLNIGGHFKYQTGMPWVRSEGVSVVNVDPNDPRGGTAESDITLNLHERGARGRREADSYVLNLSVAYGFPMGWKDLRGEVRVEGVNVTNQQRVTEHTGLGELYPARRFFQRPRQLRASFTIGF